VRFLLDANVVFDFQHSGQLKALADAAGKLDLAFAEQVADEACLVRAGDSAETVGKKREADRILRGSTFSTIEILPGSPEAALMAALLSPLRNVEKKDQGEAASIAVASTDVSVVFVTGDTKAVLWALNELYGSGERVMRTPVFVRRLYDKGALSANTIARVAARVAGRGAPPTWWASWLASIRR